MWWKIYSWIFIILASLTILYMVSGVSTWTFYDWIVFVSAILAVFVLYAHLYRRDAVSKDVWRILFWISVGSGVLDFVIFLSPLRGSLMRSGVLVGEYSGATNLNEYIFYFLLGLPIYYANYILAYKSLKQTKSSKKSK